jgi:type II secretory ATPase GspE/PulE/Tfp pilus assembly ATPase PilB-like protein
MDLIGLLAATPPGGDYISIWKLLPALLILLLWLRLLTWADKDAVAAHLPREGLNSGLLAGVVVAFLAFFLIPSFILGFLAILLIVGAEVGVYLLMRKKTVGLKDLKSEIKGAFSGLKKEKVAQEIVGQVQLLSKSGIVPAPTEGSPDANAYSALQALFADPLRKEAEQIDLVPAAEEMIIRYVVDGFAYRGGSTDKQIGAETITYLKRNAGMDIADRRKPQKGSIKLSIDGKKRELQVETKGTTAGEQLSLVADAKKRHALRMEELGFTDVQLELMKDVVHGNAGIVLVSAPKGSGLTTLMYAILRAHDAFLTHIHTIERAPDIDLEGITQNKLAPNATGAEEAKQTRWVIDQQPDTIAITSIEDTSTAMELVKFAKEGKRVYIGVRAGNTQEALAQWVRLIGNEKRALEQLILVISGRVVRKLCNACKVGYAPDPTTLKKLNMDPDRVSKLYQERKEPMRDPKGQPVLCEFCHELHFKGRSGVYEMFIIDEDAKAAAEGGVTSPQMKMAFRKQRAKYLQEQALLLVEKGDTSVQEVLRVLKSDQKK